MANNVIVIGAEKYKPSYVSGKVVRVHEENIYDVRLPDGQVKAYVENVSSSYYNSGDYVTMLVIGENETKSCKIIGKGRKLSDPSSIKIVVV